MKATLSILLVILLGAASILPARAFLEPPVPVRVYPGDVDLDGEITAADARIALRASSKLIRLSREAFIAADVDEDGIITAADARIILRMSARLPYIEPAPPEIPLEDIVLPPSWFIDIPPQWQYPDFPSGCESVTIVMCLNYHGINISAKTFIDVYLDKTSAPYRSGGVFYSADPRKYFLGNPRSKSGWGIFPTGIEAALKKFVDPEMFDIVLPENMAIDDMCKRYLINDIPFTIWATCDMRDYTKTTLKIIDTGETISWYSPNHCLLLVGYDAKYYYFSDSAYGKVTKFSKDRVNYMYDLLGRKSLLLVPKS